MNRRRQLTPRMLQYISIVLLVLAIVALILWLMPVFSGQTEYTKVWPAFAWVIMLAVVVLLLNYSESRRHTVLRRAYVSDGSYVTGTSAGSFQDVFELIERLVISYVRQQTMSTYEAPDAPDDAYLLTIETLSFEFYRIPASDVPERSIGAKLSALLNRQDDEDSYSFSVVRWTGAVRVFGDDGSLERKSVFRSVDELEAILTEALRK